MREDGMMTDRELLELAAKAAGIELTDWSEIEQAYRRKDGGYFRALTDDGDALRLAVKLNMDVTFGRNCHGNYTICRSPLRPTMNGEPLGVGMSKNDAMEAARCAIVRAAAEISKTAEVPVKEQ
jgi:hypothetical protein